MSNLSIHTVSSFNCVCSVICVKLLENIKIKYHISLLYKKLVNFFLLYVNFFKENLMNILDKKLTTAR